MKTLMTMSMKIKTHLPSNVTGNPPGPRNEDDRCSAMVVCLHLSADVILVRLRTDAVTICLYFGMSEQML